MRCRATRSPAGSARPWRCGSTRRWANLPEPLSPLGEAPSPAGAPQLCRADCRSRRSRPRRRAADARSRASPGARRHGRAPARSRLSPRRRPGRAHPHRHRAAEPRPRAISPQLFEEGSTRSIPGSAIEDVILAAFAVEKLAPEQIGMTGSPALPARERRHGPALRPARRQTRARRARPPRTARKPHPRARLGGGAGERCSPHPPAASRGGVASPRVRAMLPLPGSPASRRVRSGCSSRRSRSRRFGCCPTTRRSVLPGAGAPYRVDAAPTGRSAIAEEWWRPMAGQKRGPAPSMRSATITGSRTRTGGASGCSGQGFPTAIARRAGSSMASLPESRASMQLSLPSATKQISRRCDALLRSKIASAPVGASQ